jgi:hypothetical protein
MYYCSLNTTEISPAKTEIFLTQSVIIAIRSRRMSWVGRLALVGRKRNAGRILVRKPEGKRPFRRSTLKL